MSSRGARRPQRLVVAVGVVVGLALAVLTASAIRATSEWQRSSALLISRWTDETADLLLTALARDMSGAQRLLASRDFGAYETSPHADQTEQVAAAFARYPYPESFFVWRHGAVPGLTVFNRADRPPAWMSSQSPGSLLYPVVVIADPLAVRVLARRIVEEATARRRYAIFEAELGNEAYQIVARLDYTDSFHEQVQQASGFMVNLAWVRQNYFAEITSQVARIVDKGINMDVAVLDERGTAVSGHLTQEGATRPFPLLFADPSLVMHRAADLPLRTWSVRVSAQGSAALSWTTRGPLWTRLTIVGAAVALGLSLIVTTHAVRAGAKLSEIRSDFVSTVTHELKTPLATIRAVGDTLVHGRVHGVEQVGEYAQLLVAETKRLIRLVDNLLAYARVTDVTEVYSFEPLSPAELVDDALRGFRFQLAEGQFDVHVEVPPDLPLIRGDRTALCLAIDNLIDNAIRHSPESRWLGISARLDQSHVHIDVRDRGNGIPPDEIEAVQRKFIRGRFARANGSGLGLAIVHRVIADHGGTFRLESIAHRGTVARLSLRIV